MSVIYSFRNKLEFCPRKASPAYSNKHSTLVRKFVNYGQKSFITLFPGGKTSRAAKFFDVVLFRPNFRRLQLD
jgi:hypothetical protein